MSDYGPRSTVYTTDGGDSTAWATSSGAARRTPPAAPVENPAAPAAAADDGGWSKVRWSRPGGNNSAAPPQASAGGKPPQGGPTGAAAAVNTSAATSAPSPLPHAPLGGVPPLGAADASGMALPTLPPAGDPFWATVPQPPQWLLAALPFMMQQQQQQQVNGGGGGGAAMDPNAFAAAAAATGGFPPGMMPPPMAPLPHGGIPHAQHHRSASQNSNSRYSQQHHQQMAHPPGPSNYHPADGGYSSLEDSEPLHGGYYGQPGPPGHPDQDDPEREDDERMYEFRENSPSNRERRNLRHLRADASRHFQEVHRSRTPPSSRNQRSRNSGGMVGGNRGLTPDELRRLQRHKAETINRNRSNVLLEKERMQKAATPRGRSPNTSRKTMQNSQFPGPQPSANRSNSARGPSPTPIPGRSAIVGKVGPTRRDLVGNKPQLEDALRNGVPPRYSRRGASAHQQEEPQDSHHNHSRQSAAHRREASRDARREVEESLRDAGAVPPQAEYVKGVEDLYHRLRAAYSNVQKDPHAYLQSASLHAATQHTGGPKGAAAAPHLNTSLNLPHNRSGRSGHNNISSSAAPFHSTNFSLQNNSVTAAGAGEGGSPNQQTKNLVDQLDKLEAQWQQLTSLQERNRGESQDRMEEQGIPTNGESSSYMSTLPRRGAQGADGSVVGSGVLSASGLQTKEGVLQRLNSTVSTGSTSRLSRKASGPTGELSMSTEAVLERVRSRARQRSQSQIGHQ